ncbi:hypothetical protein [Sulfurovum sp. bin170]|nr:hypothetical protein [Sulfurovum sp. bin170]
MQENDSVLYYIVYGIILVAFYIVLKSPKKGDTKDSQKKDER